MSTSTGGEQLIVSFTIHPHRGSEEGVGWAFLRAAMARTPATERVHLLFDARDEAVVREELQRLGEADRVRLHPVTVPAPLLRRYGNRRKRQTYLGWLPKARTRLRAILRTEPIGVVHQVTFATAVLPPVLGTDAVERRVWGPLAVPLVPTAPRDGTAGPVVRSALVAARSLAKVNLRDADLVITNNHHSADFVRAEGRRVVVEPNIVVEPRPAAAAYDEDRLVMAGHLLDRKRPWLAVQALADPRLADLRLDVLGGGALLPDLTRLAEEEGVADRVRFLGEVSRDEAIESMATSRLLVHPSVREGSPWVVGEAAASGVASVVMHGSGAEATVELSANGGVVAPPAVAGQEASALAAGIVQALAAPRPAPSARWSADRLPGLLDAWYGDL